MNLAEVWLVVGLSVVAMCALIGVLLDRIDKR